MSSAKEHNDWLSLLEISGPFLSINALTRVFPQGIDAIETTQARDLRSAYNEWQENSKNSAYHRAWILYVLQTILGWDGAVLAEGQGIPEQIHYRAVEHGGSVIRPDFTLHHHHDPTDCRALVMVYDADQNLDKPLPHASWSASPISRLLSLLYSTGVRLGIVTNGEQWMLINASRTGLAGYISWYAELWNEDRITLRAFTSLLDKHRFFGVTDDNTLVHMLDESLNDAQEVTDQLGMQVRHAVEILVRALDKADQDRQGTLLAGISEATIYESALTVMMRLVFLLSAEERGLFLLGYAIYDQNYAISTLRAQLHEGADKIGEDVLERRYDAWSRLLATFRLVYFGASHQDLSLPAYGGSLFDPDRFPFLEGRPSGSPPTIDNRVVLHLLDALQILQTKGEARRLSFRALDIEQIGHVYEGLLDHKAQRATGVILGFEGKLEPEIALTDIEAQATVTKFLKDATGRGENAIKNDLNRPPDVERQRRLGAICGDNALYQRILPYINLLRIDEKGYPIVILPGSLYVTAGTERRATGTHYTPKSLTEPIVQHTLEPLVYHGVAEGAPRDQWQLKHPTDILSLKICDMAMGSGAFLVQACRYLAERLVEAWSQLPNITAPNLTIYGEIPTQNDDILIPTDPAERETLAKRLIADRCLYGVDKNPLAVEMGKLSLWLTTLAKGRPFTFLDHAFKCGDSLAGVSLDQLRNWSLDTSAKAKNVPLLALLIREQINKVIDLRRKLESFTVTDVDDQKEKERLYAEAEANIHTLRSAGNWLLASYLNADKADIQKAMRSHLLDAVQQQTDIPEGYHPAIIATDALPPFHWELEFPEVFLRDNGGFDAIVGNPPFMGGSKITGSMGVPYRDYLVDYVANGRKGIVDLCAYFFLRAYANVRGRGTFGLIATNTIAQGDTREVGLDQLYEHGATFYHALNNYVWAGQAAVVVDVVLAYKGTYHGEKWLDGVRVDHISSLLDNTQVVSKPYQLIANADKSFIGSYVLGMGFVLQPEEAEALIQKDPRNTDVLFPYLNGEDLNSHPEQAPSRWVINFFNWSEEEAMQYPDCYAIVRERVYPERQQNAEKKLRDKWWIYKRATFDLYHTIAPLNQVLVLAQISRTLAFAYVEKGIVYSHRLIVFSFSKNSHFTILQSVIHEIWARKYASTLKQDLSYTPSDAFQTFPFPPTAQVASLEGIGEAYHTTRRDIMRGRWEGLTATYNRFHNPKESSDDIASLRALHRQMDEAVALAYGWSDMDLGHDFYETAQGIRYTIHDSARREALKRLLALNFERHEDEVAQGLFDKPKPKGKKSAPKSDGVGDDAPKMRDMFDEES